MTTTSAHTDETVNPWESNSTQVTPDAPSPGNTPQSPYSASMDPPSVSTFPITTSLIPQSMISMNGIPLPPTMQRVRNNKHHATETNHPRTDPPSSSRSRSRHRKTRSTHPPLPSHSTSPSNHRSRSRDRTSKHNHTCRDTTHITSEDDSPHHDTTVVAPAVYDLTACSTPITTSESEDSESHSDSDIEIIDTVLNNNNNNINHNNDTLPSRSATDPEDNFERYTLDGIGGKLLRKAGWDGNTDTLYEKDGGPIEQSNKYRSLQRNKNGLGYVFTYAHQGRNTQQSSPHKRRKRIERAFVYPLLTHPRPLPPPHHLRNNRRVRMPIMHRANRNRNNNNNNNNHHVSNTMDTAIEISDDEDDHKVHTIEHKEDDDEVVLLDKYQVTQGRLNGIAFGRIINEMCCEKEEITKRKIVSQFAGSKRKIAITKMVISIKDSYSQTKIVVPVRGKNCKHLQPFDAKCFLLRPKKYQKCTQCNMSIKKKDLIKIAYFEKIFADIEDDVEQIEIMRNAEWKVVKQKQAKQLRRMRESASVVISDESEDDEDGEQQVHGSKTRDVVDLCLDTSDSDSE